MRISLHKSDIQQQENRRNSLLILRMLLQHIIYFSTLHKEYFFEMNNEKLL
jgi:hypothetical protein